MDELKYRPVKYDMVRSLMDSSIEVDFWYQMKAPIFLITPVKFYVQQMLFEFISENVATVR